MMPSGSIQPPASSRAVAHPLPGRAAHGSRRRSTVRQCSTSNEDAERSPPSLLRRSPVASGALDATWSYSILRGIYHSITMTRRLLLSLLLVLAVAAGCL